MARERRQKQTSLDVKRHFLFVTTSSTSENPKRVAADDVVRWTSLDSTDTVKLRFNKDRTPLLNGKRKLDLGRREFDDTSIDSDAMGVYPYRLDGSTPPWPRRAGDDDLEDGGVSEPQRIVEGRRGRARKKR